MDRVLALHGVHNFRDYGGYPVVGGGRLKRGVLWRSGQHQHATQADLDAIASLGLTAVFDLRSNRERKSYPCRRPDAFAANVYESADPVVDHSKASAPHIAAAQTKGPRTPEGTRETMRRLYGKIAFRPELQHMTAQLIATAAAGGGATLVNCMAGKDRTGIAVALLHRAAGVHQNDVVEDYLMTNTAGDVERRIEAGIETIRAAYEELDDASLRVLMGVEPEYLDIAFASIAQRHGSTETYLTQALGVDQAMRERLRAALVE